MTKNRPAIAEIVELLGTKWVMRIIWELRSGPMTFRELQSHCDAISPTVLNHRLKLLEDALLLDKQNPGGYLLTGLGQELLQVYEPLNDWAVTWQAARRSCSIWPPAFPGRSICCWRAARRSPSTP